MTDFDWSDMNPLDWAGEDFLALYIPLAVLALALVHAWRNRLGSPGRTPTPTADGLDAMHLGYLAGGAERAMDTALVGLFEAEAAQLDRKRGVIVFDRGAEVPREFQPFRHVSEGEAGRRSFHRQFAARCERIREDLARRGLVPSESQAARFRSVAGAVLCAVVLLGVVKVLVGLSRNRPVGILVITLVILVVAGSRVIGRPPFRNLAGGRLLVQQRRDHARAARAPLPVEVALAFALTGSAVLGGRAYAGFLQQGSGSSGDSSSSDSGSDGGGDGGCGGCSG